MPLPEYIHRDMISFPPSLSTLRRFLFTPVGIIISVVLFVSVLTIFTTQTLPTDDTNESFEEEQSQPDSRQETLPDGSVIRYKTQHGPFTNRRLEELKKLLWEK